LYPKDQKIRTQINQYLFWHMGNTRLCSGLIFRPYLFGAITGKKENLPTEKDFKSLKSVFLTISGWLSNSDYLVGNRLTVADIFCYCEIDQLYFSSLFDFTDFPNILKWIEKMKKLPFHDEAHKGLDRIILLINQSKSKL